MPTLTCVLASFDNVVYAYTSTVQHGRVNKSTNKTKKKKNRSNKNMTNIDSYIDGKSISEMRVAKAVVFPDSL